METIILASRSPRRSEILRYAGIPFEIVCADADESYTGCPDGRELTVMLAKRKLDAVCAKTGDERLVLAADTVVCRDGMIFGKPEDKKDAKRMLSLLSDGWHEVCTGIAMRKNGVTVTDCDVTRVRMRKIEEHEIDAYIATGEPADKAGAYAIQEIGSIFVSGIEGSFHNVVGLPICMICTHMKEDFGINVL